MVACMMVETLGYKWPSTGDLNRIEEGLEEVEAGPVPVTDAVAEGGEAPDPGPDLEATGDGGNGLVRLHGTGLPATGLPVLGPPRKDLLVGKEQEAEAATTKNRAQNLGAEIAAAEARVVLEALQRIKRPRANPVTSPEANLVIRNQRPVTDQCHVKNLDPDPKKRVQTNFILTCS